MRCLSVCVCDYTMEMPWILHQVFTWAISYASDDSYASSPVVVVLFDCNVAITFEMVHKINVCYVLCLHIPTHSTHKQTHEIRRRSNFLIPSVVNVTSAATHRISRPLSLPAFLPHPQFLCLSDWLHGPVRIYTVYWIGHTLVRLKKKKINCHRSRCRRRTLLC